MRILIFGRTGQVARELARMKWDSDVLIAQLSRADCDLAELQAVRRALAERRPDIVINAAAYTAVDRAESEESIVRQINAEAPRVLAEECQRSGSALIHLSTDYVFGGEKMGAYLESDEPDPHTVYGRTKAVGESAVRDALPNHVILRTSWVFSAHGSNFVKTMLRLSGARSEVDVVADQHGAPTSARDVAKAVRIIAVAMGRGRGAWGTFHFAGTPPTTWHCFARSIFEVAGKNVVVTPVSSAQYPTVARRPSNSILDCGKILTTYGIKQPSWHKALVETVSELRSRDSCR
ncbi:MAG TPA: dTDP-4-dehydrorhamnose reductase [Rhizomicrobium sp.]|jgi:dTDP-4-dehydrorhamnose reductase